MESRKPLAVLLAQIFAVFGVVVAIAILIGYAFDRQLEHRAWDFMTLDATGWRLVFLATVQLAVDAAILVGIAVRRPWGQFLAIVAFGGLGAIALHDFGRGGTFNLAAPLFVGFAYVVFREHRWFERATTAPVAGSTPPAA